MSDAGTESRRSFLTGGLVGAAAGILGAAGAGVFGAETRGSGGPAVHAGETVKWRLASSFPSSLDTIYGAAEVLRDRVAAMTGGRFEIQVFQQGELVQGLAVMDAVQSGSIQAGQTAGYYYIGKNPALAFDTCVPFGLTPRQQNAWLFEGGGLDAVRRLYADFDIVSFPCGNTGVQMGGWFRQPVETLADLKGLRMRIPGLGGHVMNALGVTVQVLAGGDIYPALERGAIDATEWVGPYDDEKLGFWQVAKHYYYPGWWEPGPSLSFLVNRGAWAALPAEYREVFTAASHEAASAMQTRYDEKNPAALQRLIGHGVELRPFSDAILGGAREAATAFMNDQATRDATYRTILEGWRKFRAASFKWFSTAELAYSHFAWR